MDSFSYLEPVCCFSLKLSLRLINTHKEITGAGIPSAAKWANKKQVKKQQLEPDTEQWAG